MRLALRSGQPFADLLDWHPRDVDSAWQIYVDDHEQQQEQARDERFAAMSAELRQRMRR